MTTNIVQSISDEQLAEIEKTAEIASLSGGDWWNFSNLYDLMEDSADIEFISAAKPKDILGLIARLRAAEVDAKRLDFMMREGCVIESQNGWMSPTVHRLYWRDLGEHQSEWYPTEREAIDAAMELDK